MPKQIFEIIRAPESPPIKAEEIRSLLYAKRRDTEWSVTEIATLLSVEDIEKKERELKATQNGLFEKGKVVFSMSEKAKKKQPKLSNPRYWFCVIGPVPEKDIPFGGDFPPRQAAKIAIANSTGHNPMCASGWCSEDEAKAMMDAEHKTYEKLEKKRLKGS